MPTTLNILFVGNSFTARNDVPGTIAAMAASRGHRLTHKLLSIGGASLRTHWNKGDAPRAIKTGDFTHVVLQEQSTLPIKNRARFHENVLLFDEPIRAAGSKVILYQTWARRAAADKQDALTDAYDDIGRQIKAIVVPVGRAWHTLLHSNPDAPALLYDKDGSHPSPAGSYLAACTFLAVLFGENPTGALGPDPTAAVLQRAAWSAVKGR
jgi:hypothetical protein